MRAVLLRDPERQLAAIWRDSEAVLVLRGGHPSIALKFRELVGCPDLGGHILLASSGTSGATKIVAVSRAALETSAFSVNSCVSAGPNDVWMNPLPCFHVGGLAIYVRANLAGSKVEYLSKWNPHDFVHYAQSVAATLTSLVPTQVHDLIQAGLRCPASLRAVFVGGATLDDRLRSRALEHGWPILRTYGMTEASSQVATERRPDSSQAGWLPLLDHWEARIGENGVLSLRGPSLLTGWAIFDNDGASRWEDPKRDGWLRTNDRVELRGRELRVLGRADDLVKIRGELVDIGALEATLQARVPAGRIAVYCVPDQRNGAALRVVAGNATAMKQARALRDEIFPPYARPEEFVEEPIEMTALGKIVRRPEP